MGFGIYFHEKLSFQKAFWKTYAIKKGLYVWGRFGLTVDSG
jgi:hypothetical protein